VIHGQRFPSNVTFGERKNVTSTPRSSHLASFLDLSINTHTAYPNNPSIHLHSPWVSLLNSPPLKPPKDNKVKEAVLLPLVLLHLTAVLPLLSLSETSSRMGASQDDHLCSLNKLIVMDGTLVSDAGVSNSSRHTLRLRAPLLPASNTGQSSHPSPSM
jgi:hypothetical protein